MKSHLIKNLIDIKKIIILFKKFFFFFFFLNISKININIFDTYIIVIIINYIYI